jgi:hypothetical protein
MSMVCGVARRYSRRRQSSADAQGHCHRHCVEPRLAIVTSSCRKAAGSAESAYPGASRPFNSTPVDCRGAGILKPHVNVALESTRLSVWSITRAMRNWKVWSIGLIALASGVSVVQAQAKPRPDAAGLWTSDAGGQLQGFALDTAEDGKAHAELFTPTAGSATRSWARGLAKMSATATTRVAEPRTT